MRKIAALSVVMAFTFAVSPIGLLAFTAPTDTAGVQQQVQAQGGSVKGTATDKNKNPLVGAKVNLINAQGQTVQSTTTASGGAFTFTGVAPGTYTVQIVGPSGVIGTMTVTVAAGQVATISVATTAAAATAAAAAGGGGLLSGTSLAVIGAIGGGIAVIAVVANASSSS